MAKRKKSNPKPESASFRKAEQDTPVHSSMDPEPAAETDLGPRSREAFPIVGIGASAGGLAAIEAFFSGMPAKKDPNMAFVLVQHLAPDHKSILTELVKRYTRMQVFEVEDGMAVRPNCVYIIPPNRDMAFLNGLLQLLEPTAPHGHRLPIDFFFRSLAQDQHERAIGIVLSGTGSDGTLGVRAIKGEGGMVMAQSSDSAEYNGMPSSAIATGLVDYELPPAEMPVQLIAYVDHALGNLLWAATTPVPTNEIAMKKVFVLLRAQTGHDFSQYKMNTIHRRIERRMAIHQIETIDEYVRYLQQDSAEVDILFRDLLIGVTSFFRDPEAFATLEEKVIPQLFSDRAADAMIRVWVPGCSTGEEAYSIAILLQEYMKRLKLRYNVQVFATDIDRQAIEQARAGVYPASVLADISPERLSRFFVQEPDGMAYRIHKNIRDMLIFSEQDVIKDPPFSKLDLISCRNLLIYMNGDLQKKLMPLFHYALQPRGTLFLGTSETVGEFIDLFATLDRKSKLYQRKEDFHKAQHLAIGRFFPPLTTKGETFAETTGSTVIPRKLPLRELTERTLLQQVAIAGILVNGKGDIFYLHGRTGMYLEPATGEASINNVLKMAREGLAHKLTSALLQAVRTNETVRHEGLRVKTNGNFTTVNLTISPVTTTPATTSESPLYLVILEEASVAPKLSPQDIQQVTQVTAPDAADVDMRIVELKQKLQAKEEYLQSTIEELETTNEELKSSNEEMQSVNEELQSTNEELETSKEELQSVNEELATVNTELQNKVADLSRANNDMNNLLAGTGIGTVFVDHQLRILRFTPAAAQVINLIKSDVGRPVAHLASNLAGYDMLVSDVQAVLDTLVLKEIEVQTTEGKWYSMRIQPYRTLDNVIEGAVITFVEISKIKQMEAMMQKTDALQRLAVVLRDSYDAITIQDMEGRFLAWNPGAERMYGWSEEEALAMNVRDMIPEGQQKAAVAQMKQLARAEVLEPYHTQRIAKDGRILKVWMTATALVNQAGKVYAIATTEKIKMN